MRRPLFALALSWMAGIIISEFFTASSVLPIAGSLGVLLLAGLMVRGGRLEGRGLAVLLFLLTGFLGYMRAEWLAMEYEDRIDQVGSSSPPIPTHVTGTALSSLQKAGSGWRVSLVDPLLWDGHVWRDVTGTFGVFLVGAEKKEIEAGDMVRATGRWKSISRLALPGGFDEFNWSRSSGVVGNLFVKKPEMVTRTSPLQISLKDRFRRYRDNWRERVRSWLFEKLGKDEGSLALAMTTGDRAYLPPRTREDLTRSGLMHLTAISGLHITALIGFFPLIFKFIGVPRRWRALVGIAFAVLFIWLIGFRVPIIRAGILGIAVMVARFIDRPTDSLNLLGAAALAILVASPSQLGQPSFQLSFLVVLGLLLWGPGEAAEAARHRLEGGLQKWMKPTGFLYRVAAPVFFWFCAALWVSLVAAAVAAPITAFHFGQVTGNAILGNLVGVPLAILVTCLGMLVTLALVTVPLVGSVVFPVLEVATATLEKWVGWVGSFEAGFFRVVQLDIVPAVLVAAVLLLLTLLGERFENRLWHRGTLSLLLLGCLSWWPLLPGNRDLVIHFLDVGQGDACLIEFPEGETLLVDTGPPSADKPGRADELSAALLSLGVDKLEGVVLTHPEIDHFGGLVDLMANIPVETIFVSGDINETEEFLETVQAVIQSGVPVERLLAGDNLGGINETRIEILSPEWQDLQFQLGSLNERSLVLLVEVLGLRVLLSGDIGSETEKHLLKRTDPPWCHVLKVAHHGSRYSSDPNFLAAVQPEVAVIQCGPNAFGHPAEETLHRLQEVGAKVFTNADHGTIRLAWDGNRLRIKTWR